jgi:zona occludens toxin (predicted ATPase)
MTRTVFQFFFFFITLFIHLQIYFKIIVTMYSCIRFLNNDKKKIIRGRKNEWKDSKLLYLCLLMNLRKEKVNYGIIYFCILNTENISRVTKHRSNS